MKRQPMFVICTMLLSACTIGPEDETATGPDGGGVDEGPVDESDGGEVRVEGAGHGRREIGRDVVFGIHR